MPSPSYTVSIDWNAGGTFGAGEDVSDDTYSISIDRGFSDYTSRVAKVGRCTLILNNADRLYSPYLQANVLPRRLMRVQMTYGTTVTLFYGYLESIEPDSGLFGPLQVKIECVDAIAILQLHESILALQTNRRGDQIISSIVSDAYTPPGTSYDTDIDTFPFAADVWSDDLLYGKRKQRALVSVRDVCQSNWGWFYIRRDGYPTFENRHHRLLDQTVVTTFDNTMIKLGYRKSAESVFNDIEVTAHPRNVGTSNEVLWALDTDNTPAVSPGQTLTFRADFRDPDNKDFKIGGQTVISPVATTDYLGNATNGGGGGNLTTSLSVSATIYANTADLSITNTGGQTVYITLLQIRGLAVRIYAPPTFKHTDSTSQTSYQKRMLSVNAILQDDLNVADSQSQYLLARYKDPLDEVSGIEFQAAHDSTLMSYARDLEIGDRISITEDQTGLSSLTCFIQSIRHTITRQSGHLSHTVSMDIEKSEAGDFWILGISRLGLETRLAY